MNIKKIGFGFMMSLMVVFSACVDFIEPNVPYATFNTGLYLRTISGGQNINWNFFDLQSAEFSVEVEAVDAEEGETLETVEIFVRHRRLIPGVGFEFIPAASGGQVNQVQIGTMTRADFQKATENPNHPTTRYLRGTFRISAAQVAQALGVTFADLAGGDAFEIRLRATDRFGRVFSDTNRSPDVQGGFFYRSPFRYDVPIVCPSNISTADDVWDATSTSRFGTFSAEVTVRRAPNSDFNWIISDVSAGLYAAFGFSTTQEGIFNDLCRQITWVGPGSTQFGLVPPNVEEPGTWDPDTGTLTVFWRDNGNNIDGTTVLVKR